MLHGLPAPSTALHCLLLTQINLYTRELGLDARFSSCALIAASSLWYGDLERKRPPYLQAMTGTSARTVAIPAISEPAPAEAFQTMLTKQLGRQLTLYTQFVIHLRPKMFLHRFTVEVR